MNKQYTILYTAAFISFLGFGCAEKPKQQNSEKKTTQTIDKIIACEQKSEQIQDKPVFEKKYRSTSERENNDQLVINYYDLLKDEKVAIECSKSGYTTVKINKNKNEVEIRAKLNEPIHALYINGDSINLGIQKYDTDKFPKIIANDSEITLSDMEVNNIYQQGQQKFDYYLELFRNDINEAQNYFGEQKKTSTKNLRDALDMLK